MPMKACGRGHGSDTHAREVHFFGLFLHGIVWRWPRSALSILCMRSLCMRGVDAKTHFCTLNGYPQVDAETLFRMWRVCVEVLLSMRRNGAERTLCMWSFSGYAVGEHQLEVCNTWNHYVPTGWAVEYARMYTGLSTSFESWSIHYCEGKV